MTFPKTTTIVPGTSRTGLTWMLTAGLGMSLGGERTVLDLAWRYTDYGVIETGEGMGRVEWRDGSSQPLALELAQTRAKLRNHGASTVPALRVLIGAVARFNSGDASFVAIKRVVSKNANEL